MRFLLPMDSTSMDRPLRDLLQIDLMGGRGKGSGLIQVYFVKKDDIANIS